MNQSQMPAAFAQPAIIGAVGLVAGLTLIILLGLYARRLSKRSSQQKPTKLEFFAYGDFARSLQQVLGSPPNFGPAVDVMRENVSGLKPAGLMVRRFLADCVSAQVSQRIAYEKFAELYERYSTILKMRREFTVRNQ